MNIHYAPAEEKDIGLLLDMMSRFYAIDGYHFDSTISRSNVSAFIANEQLGRIWLIVIDSEMAGYLILTFCFSFEFKGKTAFVDELFLHETYRGKGIGGQVLDFVDQQSQELQLKALHLEVERHNDKGKRLYIKKGFKEHERALMTKKFT
jgi:GNAT superfamily N-acetyltransferase